MNDLAPRFLFYALTAIFFAAISFLIVSLCEKKLRSSALLLLLTLLLVRIFLPTGIFGHTLLTVGAEKGDMPPSFEETLPPTPSTEPSLSPDGELPILPDGLPTYDGDKLSFWKSENVAAVLTVGFLSLSLIGFILYLAVDIVTRRKLAKGAVRITDGKILARYTEIAAERGVEALPPLYISDLVMSPCLAGIFRQRIYLPRSDLFSEDELILLLTHELEHYRKGDLNQKLFVMSLAFFQWWNPFLWLLVKKFNLYLEAACDERVLGSDPESAAIEYTELMLKLSRSMLKKRSLMDMTAYFAKGKESDTAKRMRRLVDGNNRSRGIFLTLTLCLVATATLFLVGMVPRESELPPQTTETENENVLPGLLPSDKDGYTFSHWETVIDENGEESFRAVYLAKRYTVTFVTNGGRAIEDMSLDYHSPLPTPIREGYTFGGWFLDADLSKRVETVPLGDSTLYAFWCEESHPSAFTFLVQNGRASLIASSFSGAPVVPAYYGGYPVTVIGKYAFAQSDINAVILPNTVKEIGAGAFYGCVNLTAVTLSRELVYLDRVAFDACYHLTALYYPGSSAEFQRVSGADPDLPIVYLAS